MARAHRASDDEQDQGFKVRACVADLNHQERHACERRAEGGFFFPFHTVRLKYVFTHFSK